MTRGALRARGPVVDELAQLGVREPVALVVGDDDVVRRRFVDEHIEGVGVGAARAGKEIE